MGEAGVIRVEKWVTLSANGTPLSLKERSAVQEHFLDLCRLLGERSPAEADPTLLGIEINPYAAELARVSVWIGEIQWMRRSGFDIGRQPILKPLFRISSAATQCIRGGANRRVLDPIAQAGAVSTAWADEPWALAGLTHPCRVPRRRARRYPLTSSDRWCAWAACQAGRNR